MVVVPDGCAWQLWLVVAVKKLGSQLPHGVVSSTCSNPRLCWASPGWLACCPTGIYCSGYDPQMNAKNGFPVFSTHIEANYISKSTDAWNVYKLTDEDRQKITAMAADPRIGECVCV